MYKLAGKLSEVRMMAESHSSNRDSQEKNTLTATTDVRLAFGVPLDEVVNGGAAVDFSGNLQSTGKGSKITLTGKNKNTVTINIGGSTSYAGSVPFDIEENILLDINSVLEGFNPDNFAVGFYLSAFHSVTMSSTMLNNQKPTRNRSRVDRGVNAPANTVSLMQAIYQYTKK